MSKNAAKHKERELAFQVLYGLSFAPVKDIESLKKAFVLSPHNLDATEANLDDTPTGFAWSLSQGVWENEETLNKIIEKFSRNWRIERMGRIELIILRMALYELDHHLTPPRVVINEALELADQFGAENAKAFINGILDKAAREAENPNIQSKDCE